MEGKIIGTYDLKDRRSGGFVQADVRSPISTANLTDFQQLWRPMFVARIEELMAAGTTTVEDFGAHDLQDAHWNWVKKAIEGAKRLDWVSFAVEAEGQTQGLMFVRTAGFAREPSQINLPLVQIDLLATAPWNRLRLADAPRFKGVGHVLLAAAVSLSFHEGFDGRIGLHALPQSKRWYRDVCGMTPLGVDETKMEYFEMTEAQSRAFTGL